VETAGHFTDVASALCMGRCPGPGHGRPHSPPARSWLYRRRGL